ncbi:TrbM protein [Kosakonia sacchari]|nr:TrbM protein [Kosakonia sacchari]
MKQTAIAAALLCLAASISVPAFADEPCNMTLCMWGKVQGENSSECQGQIKKFFKKQVKKKGSFLPDHTADARKEMLQDECPSSMAPAQFIDEVISKFGRVRG